MDALIRLNEALRIARAWGLTAALALMALASSATPAGAVIEQVKDGSETIEVGVTLRQPTPIQIPLKPLQWHGGPVDRTTSFFAIYWDPAHAYHSDWMSLIDGYLHDVGTAGGQLDNPFALNAQYRAADGTRAGYDATFRGAYTDIAPYPANGCVEPKVEPTCLTDGQLRTELKRFIESEHLPTGREIVYYLLTPPAVTVCLDEGGSGDCSTSSKELEEEEVEKGQEDNKPGFAENATGFCGYHSVIEPGSESPIVYAVQPWIAGHAGKVVSEIPLATLLPTGAELACQNGVVLVEPNQAASFIHFDSYETGLADLIIDNLSLQQNDVMVDPMVNSGWYQTGTEAEQSDMCRGVYGPLPLKSEEEKSLEGTHALKVSNEGLAGGNYYLQYGYSSASVTAAQVDVCWEGVEQRPHFTATTVVKGGDILAFDAFESGLTLDANLFGLKSDEPYTAPIYEWHFGDGTSAGPTTEASVFHAYQYAGDYPVTLTVTDSGGYTRSFTETVPVGSPPAPAPPAPPISSPGGGSPGGAPATGGGPGSTGTSPTTAAGPVLVQSVLTRSLKKAVSLGLPVHYSVNEQVAGSVEVLLASSIATRLGIKGRRVTGLPPGYPHMLVVGSASLVTTRAGQGTVRIRFSKTIAMRLARAHQVKLTLRFVLRSAAHMKTTTLSTVTLTH